MIDSLEFASYAEARLLHSKNLTFSAFAYYNLEGDKITLSRNAISLRSIAAPLHQQFKRLEPLL